MLAHHYFSHKELQNLNGKQLIDKLKLDKNVIWEDYPEFFRAGVLVQRIRTEVQTENGPVIRHKVAPVRLPLPFHCLVHAARVRIVSNDFNEEENV